MAYKKPLPGGGRPSSNHSRAGSGLNSAQARAQFGDQAEVGASGERYFADLIRKTPGLAAVSDTYYSLGIPQGKDPRATRYRSDVDAVLVNGNTVVLVDVKRWKGSVFYWTLGGLPFRGLTPLQHGGKWKLSANMAGALRRYREALPGAKVSAMVVFVPTHRGDLPASVRFLKWPGAIRSYSGSGALRELQRRLGNVREVPPATIAGTLKALER